MLELMHFQVDAQFPLSLLHFLNFLAAQGWESMPASGEPHRYLLKRPRR
ncbi:hypothetical protein N008_16900 [Hymenobacter sp. APR13]|nr:hypothetical protein N008_16900 [Hymenobacter sp. APR13]